MPTTALCKNLNFIGLPCQQEDLVANNEDLSAMNLHRSHATTGWLETENVCITQALISVTCTQKLFAEW